MNRVLQFVFLTTCLVFVAIASPLSGQEKKDGGQEKKDSNSKKNDRPPLSVANLVRRFQNVQLTNEQLEKLRPIVLEARTRTEKARATFDSMIPKEMQDIRAAASKKAQQQGVSGARLRRAVDAAVKLTPEQQAAVDEFRTVQPQIDNWLRKTMRPVLNAEQRKKVGLPANKNDNKKKSNQNDKGNDQKNNGGEGKGMDKMKQGTE